MKKILMILALIMVLLAVEIIIVKSVSNYEPMVEVIYTNAKIQEKTVITKDMLTRKKIHLSLVHAQSIRQEKDIIGKTAVMDIEKNEMILSSKVGQIIEMEEIQLDNKNNRLFSIEFKPDQVNGWWVKVGQYVDIICVPNDLKNITQNKLINAEINEVEKSKDENVGIVKLENIRIAAIIDEAGKLLNNEQRTSTPKIISFEVEAGQDEYLAWAKGNARIEISTRH